MSPAGQALDDCIDQADWNGARLRKGAVAASLDRRVGSSRRMRDFRSRGRAGAWPGDLRRRAPSYPFKLKDSS
jgi:hypothetical protein